MAPDPVGWGRPVSAGALFLVKCGRASDRQDPDGDFFSSDENALTSRIIGVLSQAHNPDGSGGAGPLWGIGNSNQVGISGPAATGNGIIAFPSGVALYMGGRLVGAIGVSGDGVDQDEAVAFAGASGFLPGPGVATLGY